jgi:anti-sigma regulatory factor (Ser/Thr protein kinase)
MGEGVHTMGKAMTADGPEEKTRLRLRLYPVPQSSGIARTFVRHHLISLGFPDLVEDACTIVAELVTNAIHETPDREIWAYLSPNDGRPLLEVWDSSLRPPSLKPEDPLAETGRGLLIVRTLSAECGCRILANGKVIWALLK